MKLLQHAYEFDKIVVGWSVKAALFAFKNSLPLILNSTKNNFPFDTTNVGFPVEKYGLKGVKREIITNKGTKFVGVRKDQFRDHLLWLMSVAGLVPFVDYVNSVTFDGDMFFIATKNNNRSIKAKFNKAIIFEDDNINGLPMPEKSEQEQYMVLDWFDVSSGAAHKFDMIEGDDHFINKIWFHQSSRMCGNHSNKDLVAISYFDPSQLQNHEYMPSIARMIIVDKMEKAGITGTKRHFMDEARTKQYKDPIKISPYEREKRKISKDYYNDTEHFEFNNLTINEIESIKQEDGYILKVLERLCFERD